MVDEVNVEDSDDEDSDEGEDEHFISDDEFEWYNITSRH